MIYSWFTKHIIMALEDSSLYPIEPHISCFDPFTPDGVIYNFVRSRVVCLYVSGLLWVYHFLKGGSDWFTLFDVVEQFPHLCPRC